MGWEESIPQVQSGIYLSRNLAPDDVRGALPDGRWPVSPEEWRERAREAAAPGPWGYLEGGAGGEDTVRANREAFARWRLVPRVLQGAAERDLSVELLGRRLPAPFLLAPVGGQDAIRADGDLASARAAASCGIPFVVSTVSPLAMERVAAEMGSAPRWFQLYPGRNAAITASMVERAQASGYEALVVTVDTPILGWRERDLVHAYLPFLEGKGLGNYFSDPVFRSLLAAPPEDDPEAAIRAFLAVFPNPGLGWQDIDAVRRRWRGPLWIKGITHPGDARAAVDHGADGLIVSNHGGRQVDGAIASLDALPAVVDAAGGRVPLLMDGGVRRGADVVKALALGARAVLIGRLYQYGLAVAGEAGVRRVVTNLAADVDVTLALCGRRRAADVDRSLVAPVEGRLA